MKKGYFAGLCGLDVIYYDNGSLPEENTKGRYTEYGWAPGGPATNAARTYAKLAGESFLITALGYSGMAVMIKDMLERENVRVIDLADDDRTIGISSIHVNTATAARTIMSGQNTAAVDFQRMPPLDDALFIEYDGSLPGIEEFLLKASCELILDMGSDKESFIKCFSPGTTAITSETYSHQGKDIFEIHTETELALACRSRGSRPLQYCVNGEIKEIEVLPVQAVDSLGAGDVLHGAYCYYRCHEDMDVEQALKKASEFASLSTEVKTVEAGIRHAYEKIKAVR